MPGHGSWTREGKRIQGKWTIALGAVLCGIAATPAMAQEAVPIVVTSDNGKVVDVPALSAGPLEGNADPYVSPVEVPSGSGFVADVDLVVNGVSHSCPEDIGIALVHGDRATGVVEVPSEDCDDADGRTIRFDDEAPEAPFDWTTSTHARPAFTAMAPFDAPGPGLPQEPAPGIATFAQQSLAVFDGQAAAGTWQVFIRDYAGEERGTIDSVSLVITTTPNGPLEPPGSSSGQVDVTAQGEATEESGEIVVNTPNVTFPTLREHLGVSALYSATPISYDVRLSGGPWCLDVAASTGLQRTGGALLALRDGPDAGELLPAPLTIDHRITEEFQTVQDPERRLLIDPLPLSLDGGGPGTCRLREITPVVLPATDRLRLTLPGNVPVRTGTYGTTLTYSVTRQP